MANPPDHPGYGLNNHQGYLIQADEEERQYPVPLGYTDADEVFSLNFPLQTDIPAEDLAEGEQVLDQVLNAAGLLPSVDTSSLDPNTGGSTSGWPMSKFFDDNSTFFGGARSVYVNPRDTSVQTPSYPADTQTAQNNRYQLELQRQVELQVERLRQQQQQQQQQYEEQHRQFLLQQAQQSGGWASSAPFHQVFAPSDNFNPFDYDKMMKRPHSEMSAGEGPSGSRQPPLSPTSHRQGMRATTRAGPSTPSDNHYAASKSPSVADTRSNTNTFSTPQRNHRGLRAAAANRRISVASAAHSVSGVYDTNVTSPSEKLFEAKSMGDNTSNISELEDYVEQRRGRQAPFVESMDNSISNVSGPFDGHNTTAKSHSVRNPSTQFGRGDFIGTAPTRKTLGALQETASSTMFNGDVGNLQSIREDHHLDAAGYAGDSSGVMATMGTPVSSELYGGRAYSQYGYFGSSSVAGMDAASHGAGHSSEYGPTDHNAFQGPGFFFNDPVSTQDPKGKGKARDTSHGPSVSSGSRSNGRKDSRVLSTANPATRILPKPGTARTPPAAPNPQYSCDHCPERHETQKSLDKHVNKFHPHIPCLCAHLGCTAMFSLPSEARRHFSTIHAKWVLYYCRHQDHIEMSPFSRPDHFSQHLKKKHPAAMYEHLMGKAAEPNTPCPTHITCRYPGCAMEFMDEAITKKNGEPSVKTAFGAWFDHHIGHSQMHDTESTEPWPWVDFYVGETPYDFLSWWQLYDLVEVSEDGNSWKLKDEANGNERRRGQKEGEQSKRQAKKGHAKRQHKQEAEQQSEQQDELDDDSGSHFVDNGELCVDPDLTFTY